MNVIADRLFSLLLGWTRGIFNNLWNLLTNNSAGVVGFFERFWLPMILILLLVGTAADYIVWLIRWRPYYVWRSWFMRRSRKKRLQATQDYMSDLDQAPLDLDLGPMEYAPFTPMPPQDAAEALPQQDGYFAPDPNPYEAQPLFQAPPQAWPQQEADMPPAPQYPEPEPQPELPFAAWTAQAEDSVPWQEAQPAAPVWEDSFLPESAETPAPAEGMVSGAAAQSRRRRRSTAKRQRQPGLLRTLRETLLDPMDASEPVNSLPPPISQEDAFHQPYYPENYRYRPLSQDKDEPGA